MSDFDFNSRCEKHQVTRCIACMTASRKKPSVVVPPPEITGGPPADIEQMDAAALRQEIAAQTGIVGPEDLYSSNVPHLSKESFEALPIDDSHASKVVRAAAVYATASKEWAQSLARVERIKQELLKAEALLHEALVKKETSECDLRSLVGGVSE